MYHLFNYCYTSDDQLEIATVVKQIIEQKRKSIDTKLLEQKIDDKLYHIYGLDEREIEIVERKENGR